MWRTLRENVCNGRIVKLAFDGTEGKLCFGDVLSLLRDDAEFRTFFNGALANAPFRAFRWETPGIASATLGHAFECVLIDSPGLRRRPDPSPFAAHFGGETYAAVFSNFDRDAVMIAPVPLPRRRSDPAYVHLAAFVRGAPEAQRQTVWRRVGETTLNMVGEAPVWLNTAGAGVSWLHIRLDTRPKYYRYGPYAKGTTPDCLDAD